MFSFSRKLLAQALKAGSLEAIQKTAAQTAIVGVACLGLGITSSMAAMAEERVQGTPDPCASSPPFSLTTPYYDQATYQGRLYTMFDVINPATLFTSDTELQRCQQLIEGYKQGTVVIGKNATNEEMWHARKTVDAIIHPVTGDKIFLPGRMSAFVPMNVPICCGMLIHGPTGVGATIFWQWVNQTYNVVNNYANRSGKEIDILPLLQSYGLAVSASVGVAVGAGRMIKAYPVVARMGLFVPYLAVIAAGTCNVAFTRMEEMRKGIPVVDHEGKELGISKKAGQIAVFKTVTTRSMFLPIFPMLLPPVVMNILKKSTKIGANKPLSIAAEVGVISLCMAGALPCALAIQPQQMAIQTASLEPEFQGFRDSKNGQLIDTVYANKGL